MHGNEKFLPSTFQETGKTQQGQMFLSALLLLSFGILKYKYVKPWELL